MSDWHCQFWSQFNVYFIIPFIMPFIVWFDRRSLAICSQINRMVCLGGLLEWSVESKKHLKNLLKIYEQILAYRICLSNFFLTYKCRASRHLFATFKSKIWLKTFLKGFFKKSNNSRHFLGDEVRKVFKTVVEFLSTLSSPKSQVETFRGRSSKVYKLFTT